MSASDVPARKTARPFYPILLAAFPVLALFALNQAMVPVSDIWRPLGVSIGATTALWAALSLVSWSIPKGAILTAVFFALFATFGSAEHALGPTVLEVADVLLSGAAILLVLRHKGDLVNLTRVSNFGASILLVMPLAQVVIGKPRPGVDGFLHVSLPVQATASSVANKPDIFFIIVDGYGRADQMKRVMGYSNDPFLAELQKRGFYVEAQSHSNYVQTQLSLTATLNSSFLQDYPKTFPATSSDRSALLDGMDKSFVASYLKKLGYVYISVTSGFNEVNFESSDVRYDGPLALTMIEDALVQLTPITLVDQPIKSLFDDRRKSLQGAFQNLTYLGTKTSNPRFVVAHILAPHPPFVFGADGQIVRQDMPFGFWDGSHYMSENGTPSLYRTGYVGQVQYLNKQLLSIVDSLIAKAGSKKPVIIIEGDHGSKLGLEQERIEKSDLHEAFGNLMAFYGPDSLKNLLYPKMSSFNTFRVVLNGLFGEKLPLLPDRSFYSPFSLPYRFTEVTKQIAD